MENGKCYYCTVTKLKLLSKFSMKKLFNWRVHFWHMSLREWNKAEAQAAADVLPWLVAGMSSRKLSWPTAAESLAKTINMTTGGTRNQQVELIEKLLVQRRGCATMLPWLSQLAVLGKKGNKGSYCGTSLDPHNGWTGCNKQCRLGLLPQQSYS